MSIRFYCPLRFSVFCVFFFWLINLITEGYSHESCLSHPNCSEISGFHVSTHLKVNSFIIHASIVTNNSYIQVVWTIQRLYIIVLKENVFNQELCIFCSFCCRFFVSQEIDYGKWISKEGKKSFNFFKRNS